MNLERVISDEQVSIDEQAIREYGGGIQTHSCGANYPYVIGQQETGLEDGSVYWFAIGGRLGSKAMIFFPTHARVQEYIDWLKAGDALRAAGATDRHEGQHITAAIQHAAAHALAARGH